MMEKRNTLYFNRFASCAHVFNVIENGEPLFSRCAYGAKGHINQKPDIKNVQSEICTICKKYEYRESNIKAISKDKVSSYIDGVLNEKIKTNKENMLIQTASHLYMELPHVKRKEGCERLKLDTSSGKKKITSSPKGYLDII